MFVEKWALVKPLGCFSFQIRNYYPMRQKFVFIFLALIFINAAADAQFRRVQGRPRHGRPQQKIREKLPRFTPTVNLSFGYGFPALDKDFLPEFYEAYRGNVSQTGSITGALDYQFSRRMSVGIVVTHNKVSAPYYDYYSSSSVPAFTADLNNWSFMLNITRYIPLSAAVTPYIKTAIGINAWQQTYTDVHGNEAPVIPAALPDLAYQVGLGARFNVSKNAGLFIEAGYGKYIAHGGLSLRF